MAKQRHILAHVQREIGELLEQADHELDEGLDQTEIQIVTLTRERDEAREHGTYKYTKWVEDQWNQAISEHETAERERDEARGEVERLRTALDFERVKSGRRLLNPGTKE